MNIANTCGTPVGSYRASGAPNSWQTGAFGRHSLLHSVSDRAISYNRLAAGKASTAATTHELGLPRLHPVGLRRGRATRAATRWIAVGPVLFGHRAGLPRRAGHHAHRHQEAK